MTIPIKSSSLVVLGKKVREDANGLICLNDIFALGDGTNSQQPTFWRRSRGVGRLVDRLREKLRISQGKPKLDVRSVIYSKYGRGGGMYAHPLLAAEYAGYLNPDLRLEVLDTWLRFRSGDAKLADAILENASDDDNKWAAMRAMGRVRRRAYTDILQRAGVKGMGYARCTNAIYGSLFDKSAKQIKIERSVKSTRDGMTFTELSQVMLSEGLASERIEDERCQGTSECAQASAISAGFVRQAVEADRASRNRKRLL